MMSSVFTIPEKMKKLVVIEGGETVQDCKIEVQEVDVPRPASNELLVKIVAAAVNPYDYGSWLSPKTPMQATGMEGSGIVVATGGGLMTMHVSIGQKVGVMGPKQNQGTYSEYVTVSAMDGYFPLPNDLPVEDAAGFFGNPCTALGIMYTAKQANCKALVHTAAASQVGQMMVKLANNEYFFKGIEIINVVRREEQVKLLEDLGAKQIINSSQDDWKEQLKLKIQELECSVAFDAVAGPMTREILECLPPKGSVYVYGGLGGHYAGIDLLDLIFLEKQLKSFFLLRWLKSGGLLFAIPRMYSSLRMINAGLVQGGWSCSQFKDIALEDVQKECCTLLEGGATGVKLRVRFDA
jgi:NADPH:quinone reductase-like Zn-dependent oxidoreductase